MKAIYALTIVVIMITVGPACAQWEFTPQVAFEQPYRDLKWIYNPTQTYGLVISKTDKYKKKREAYGGSLGYSRFTAKQDLFYYPVNENEFGTIKYDDYFIYKLDFSARRDFIVSKHFELFIGVEVGYHYVKYGYAAKDPYSDDAGTFIQSHGALAPKTGITYAFNKNISASLQTRFTAALLLGETNNDEVISLFWSNGVSLNFRFGEK